MDCVATMPVAAASSGFFGKLAGLFKGDAAPAVPPAPVAPPLFINARARGDSSKGLINDGEDFKYMPGLYHLPAVGDVVVFTIPQGPHKGEDASHVVISRNEDGTMQTRGSNNSFNDPWVVDEKMYKGRVINKHFDVSTFAPAGPVPAAKVIRR